MAYFIYENWQGPHMALLHHGGCGFCNDGKSLAGGEVSAEARDARHGR